METRKTKELLQRIEEERKILNKFSYNENFDASQVVALSQRLDDLLNEYYRLNCGIT